MVHGVPLLRQRGGGVIVNTASIGAIAPRPNITAYNATKGAVLTMTRGLAVELARDNIRVSVEPLPGAEDPCPKVLRCCRRVFGDEVAIEVGSVPELAPASSEKHRFIRALE